MSFYDSGWGSQRRNRFNRYQRALQRIAAKRQAAQMGYAAGSSKLAIEKPNVLRNVLNNFSGRGMAHSSGYGQEVQRTETDFAGRLASLAQQRTAEESAANLEESGETSSYQYDLSDLAGQQANWEAQQEQERVRALAEQQAIFNAPAGNAASGPERVAQARQMSKKEWLSAHPHFANLSPAERKEFLKKHPKMAEQWAAYSS